MIRKVTGNQPNPSELFSYLYNCEHRIFLASVLCSALSGNPIKPWFNSQWFLICFLGEFLELWVQAIDGTEFYCSGNTDVAFGNYSFVFSVVNRMTQVPLADKMLSQVDLHLHSANADKMSGWVTGLCFKVLHTKKKVSKRFLNPERLINTPITSQLLKESAKFTAAQ